MWLDSFSTSPYDTPPLVLFPLTILWAFVVGEFVLASVSLGLTGFNARTLLTIGGVAIVLGGVWLISDSITSRFSDDRSYSFIDTEYGRGEVFLSVSYGICSIATGALPAIALRRIGKAFIAAPGISGPAADENLSMLQESLRWSAFIAISFVGVALWSVVMNQPFSDALLSMVGWAIASAAACGLAVLPAIFLTLTWPKGWKGIGTWAGAFAGVSVLLFVCAAVLTRLGNAMAAGGYHDSSPENVRAFVATAGSAIGFASAVGGPLLLSHFQGVQLVVPSRNQPMQSVVINVE
jgi:hypothetical protein